MRDVARLHGFLSPKNRDAAKRAVATIRQGVKLFAECPEIGRPVDEMPPEFRKWPIGFGAAGYIVLYRYDRPEVVIVAVRHDREAGY